MQTVILQMKTKSKNVFYPVFAVEKADRTKYIAPDKKKKVQT